MAGEGPDPKTFASWEEAFQYSIPAVRGMERQLRRDIDSNKEKLRTLVGYAIDLAHLAKTFSASVLADYVCTTAQATVVFWGPPNQL